VHNNIEKIKKEEQAQEQNKKQENRKMKHE
jgi:hypothetical protein